MTDEKVFPLTVMHADNIDGPPKPGELHAINLKNGKPIPEQMKLNVMAPRRPNHAHVFVKLPDQDQFEDLGDLPIKDGIVFLPVPFVFLCHAKEDAGRVWKINQSLRAKGILTWMDKQDLAPGDRWRGKIKKAIDTSDFVLVFISNASATKRGTVQREIKYALDQMMDRPSSETYIIPVLLEKCQPPDEFADLHWSFAWKDGWIDDLMCALRA